MILLRSTSRSTLKVSDSMSSVFARILASFLLLFSILFMPFGVSVILALAGMIYFSKFYEATALFLLSDLLYGTKEARGFPIIFISFFVSIIILLIIEIVKKKLKFYK